MISTAISIPMTTMEISCSIDKDKVSGKFMKKVQSARCIYCNALIPKDVAYCPQCRHSINDGYERVKQVPIRAYRVTKTPREYFTVLPYTGYIFCANCGQRLEIGSECCDHCGAQIADKQAEKIASDKKNHRKKAWKQFKLQLKREKNIDRRLPIFPTVLILAGIGGVLFLLIGHSDVGSMLDHLTDNYLDSYFKKDIPIANIEVSSVNEFKPMYLCDNDLDTAWSEKIDAAGTEQQITLYFADTYTVEKLQLWSEDVQNDQTLSNNAQIREATLTYSDGKQEKVVIRKSNLLNDISTVYLKKPVETSSIKISIDSVYEQNKENICISEIRVQGKGETTKLPEPVHRNSKVQDGVLACSDEIGTKCEAYPKPIRTLINQQDRPMVGEDVKFVQAALYELGFTNVSVTGVYEDTTIAAVKQFQQENGVASTGVIDHRSAKKLYKKLKTWRIDHQNDTDRIIWNDYSTLIDAKKYKAFTSDKNLFTFYYPEGFYSHMEHVDTDETETIRLWNDGDKSAAEFSCVSRTDHLSVAEQYRDLYDQTYDLLYDPEVILNAEKTANGGARFILTGYEGDNHKTEVYDLVYITDEWIREMKITFPSKRDTEDMNHKWYYVESMYRMCSFSNSSLWARSYQEYIDGVNSVGG